LLINFWYGRHSLKIIYHCGGDTTAKKTYLIFLLLSAMLLIAQFQDVSQSYLTLMKRSGNWVRHAPD
jgi:hypothetical protein